MPAVGGMAESENDRIPQMTYTLFTATGSKKHRFFILPVAHREDGLKSRGRER
jgi:hypothetical protein